MATRIRFMAPILAAVLLFAACGGDGGGDGTNGGGGGDVTLTTVDNEFQPASLTAAAGDTISITNDGSALHNLTITDADVEVDIEAGGTASATLPADLAAGEYEMICEYHESQGMTGTLVVA